MWDCCLPAADAALSIRAEQGRGRERGECVCVCVHVESVWLEVKWSALTAKKGLFEGRGESSLTAAGELDRTLEWKQSDPESIDNLLHNL